VTTPRTSYSSAPRVIGRNAATHGATLSRSSSHLGDMSKKRWPQGQEFFRWLYSQGRDERDVRKVCDGLDAQGYVWAHRMSYSDLQELCEERFQAMPIMDSVRYTTAPMTNTTLTANRDCPRCQGMVLAEADQYGETSHCLACGWRD
jgi:ribosomal protein S27AE